MVWSSVVVVVVPTNQAGRQAAGIVGRCSRQVDPGRQVCSGSGRQVRWWQVVWWCGGGGPGRQWQAGPRH